MRRVLVVLAVSATASLAAASSFSIPSASQPGTIPVTQPDLVTPDTMNVTAVPAPGTAVLAIAGLAALGRRRRDR